MSSVARYLWYTKLQSINQSKEHRPIVLTSKVKKKVAAVKTGSAKRGSVRVKSVNHHNPPSFILSTGRLAIPHMPKNTDMKIGI